jgi:hypothetical protein
MEAVSLDAMLARFAEHWSPTTIAQINDYDVRIVKVRGELTWHKHPDTDEFASRGSRPSDAAGQPVSLPCRCVRWAAGERIQTPEATSRD